MNAAFLTRLVGAVAAIVLLASTSLSGQAQLSTLRLRNTFISHLKNRAIVKNLPFTVDHVKPSINSISSDGKDGDIHVAGRPGPFVGLPMVVEVVNARLEKDDVVQRLRDLEGQPATTVSGVWRLWFEHPPHGVMEQVGTVPKPTSTNPDHVFELHPLTEVDGRKADESFVMIPGFTAYTAAKTFGAYEQLEFRAKKNSAMTVISSKKAGHNYTEFDAVLAGAPTHKNDATFVVADIQTPSGKSVVKKPIRLVIADDTKVATVFASKKPKTGTKLRILGIPRVNLDILMDKAEDQPGQTVVVRGAYEIIVVGIR